MTQHVENNPPAASGLGLHNMIKAKTPHIGFYYETPLYYEASKGIGFEVYKPPFVTINDMRIKNDRLPSTLYIHTKDKLTGLKEIQKALNVQLECDLRTNNPSHVKSTLIGLVDETIKDPCEGGIAGAVGTMEIVFSEYLKNRSVIDNLINVMSKDYTTAVHSVNVMALTLRFCMFCKMKERESKKLGLSALLHDVGKLKISNKILKADRRLTESEYELMKKHTTFGYEILKSCNLPEDINLCALSHHERADGSGYPNGAIDITHEAEIIGFIDCYEALTCNDRPYRDAVKPFDALTHIKKELNRGNFKFKVYERFVKSLG
ncbi:MAG: HD domain-containing phosphohydrolase [bacterium]